MNKEERNKQMAIRLLRMVIRALEDYRRHTRGVMIPQTSVQGDVTRLYAARLLKVLINASGAKQ